MAKNTERETRAIENPFSTRRVRAVDPAPKFILLSPIGRISVTCAHIPARPSIHTCLMGGRVLHMWVGGDSPAVAAAGRICRPAVRAVGRVTGLYLYCPPGRWTKQTVFGKEIKS